MIMTLQHLACPFSDSEEVKYDTTKQNIYVYNWFDPLKISI